MHAGQGPQAAIVSPGETETKLLRLGPEGLSVWPEAEIQVGQGEAFQTAGEVAVHPHVQGHEALDVPNGDGPFFEVEKIPLYGVGPSMISKSDWDMVAPPVDAV